MFSWCREVVRDLGSLAAHGWRGARQRLQGGTLQERKLWAGSFAAGVVFISLTILVLAHTPLNFTLPILDTGELHLPPPSVAPPIDQAVRDEPTRFKANTFLPKKREARASGSIASIRFSREKDLIRIEDERVWWESEHDRGDIEDDHVFHRAMYDPIRRLIELVAQRDAVLKVQDAYRAQGIHSAKSLHKQGRAVDLTAEGLSLEELAKLSWAAGFDWVYLEWPKKGGAHVHASVRADHAHALPRP